MKYKWPGMGFTTFKTIKLYMLVGMNNTHQCIFSHMLLIIDVAKYY